MRLGSFAPVVCAVLAIGCAGSAVADALTTGPWPHSEIDPSRLPIGWLITVVSLMLVTWLALDSGDPARSWAKAALALLLVGAAIWTTVVWPSFWRSAGLDDCVVNCLRDEHRAARADVIQGKWAVAVANIGAMFCVFVAVARRTRHAA
jgi:hypothetical protein